MIVKPPHNPQSTAFLGRRVFAQIDRPLGSKHPTWESIYPLNYGYIPGVISPDGEELDAYILGVSVPVESFTGHCIAVIRRLDDSDDKLILAPEGMNFSDEEIRSLTHFQERFFASIIIREGNET
ncbi:MAG: inorganic diphosphatase [Candidatus Promineifilaceae bacterium]|nr:inorganic diphosphatase [Candidatus Promineifilaceae bacterium]